MSEANKKIQKAKVGLILNEPFFATCALKMDYVAQTGIKTCATNGKQIKYNPDFINSYNIDMIKTILAHEVLHVVLLHPLRIGTKDIRLWNQACDYAINPILQQAGFSIPEGGLIDSRFENKAAEDIYKELEQEQQNQQQNKGNNFNSGNNNENNPENFGVVETPTKKENLQELEQEIKQTILQAYNSAKQAGKEPKFMKEIIKDFLEPKKDWKQLLNKFLAEIAKNDYTWKKPNPRYLPNGLYLPALESLEIGRVIFAIDTSGSVDYKLLQQFASEIKEASTLFKMPVTIVHCDSKIQKVEEFTDQDTIEPVGRGGTEFQPVFDYVNENIEDAKAIVYFTDGHCSINYTEPDSFVLWCIYNNVNFKCSFGHIININS